MTERLVNSVVTTGTLAEAFSDAAMLRAMLEFEVALARVEARLGVIPASAADRIAGAANVSAFDVDAIAAGARESGTIAIPFVEQLRAAVRASDEAASAFVHFGATSQDVVDTALIQCLGRARTPIEADHARLIAALQRLSEQHAASVMLARTLLQPALPITFGLKAAGWFASVRRSGSRLMSAFRDSALLQFGGAAGTLASLGVQGPAVADALARELELANPEAPWHGHRDRLATLVTACGVYAGVLGKIAADVALLMQHEVAEVAEPGGTSSSMPHKRNPAGCALALAAAVRVPGLVASFLAGMPQQHERGVGGWHAEASTIAAVVQSTGSALAAIADAAQHLTVDPDRMRANLAATHGAVFAERAQLILAPSLGREAASKRIAAALEEVRRGRQTLGEALGIADLDQPDRYLGAAETFRRQLLESE